MFISLSIRITLIFTCIVGLACLAFGLIVYGIAEHNARENLDDLLKTRAASVRLGKDLMAMQQPASGPIVLPSVDSLGTNGVAIEVFAIQDGQPVLLASTSSVQKEQYSQTTVLNLGNSKVPWDERELQWTFAHPQQARNSGRFSDIDYQGQHIRVYTTANDMTGHIIQTARSTRDNENMLAELRQTLIYGAILILLLAAVGSLLISRSILGAVLRLTAAARAISTSQDLSKRVWRRVGPMRDELSILADTFNGMLSSIEDLYQRQQRFVADASHELRAPITSIRCNLDLLARAKNLPATEAEEALLDARAEAERMGRLVNDLLQLARIDSVAQKKARTALSPGNYMKTSTEIDLDSLLLEVFRQYHPSRRSAETSSEARLLLQHITPARVYGQEDQLKQVLVILIDNALKYTPAEGTVALALTTREKEARVSISDTGTGIATEDLPHIFERFYRADRTRGRDKGGSGLGLAIAQSIAQEQQGRIEVSSEVGQGSTFTLVLPLLDE